MTRHPRTLQHHPITFALHAIMLMNIVFPHVNYFHMRIRLVSCRATPKLSEFFHHSHGSVCAERVRKMPIQVFQIFLDKVKEPYTAGEKVTGKFVIVVSDFYAHNGIFLKFEGHAIIKWTEDSSCFEHTVAKQNRARKQFFDTIFKYASEETLGDGTHIFPFEYMLPSNLPSSLSTPTITIWYKMEALIHKDPKPRREVLIFPVKGQLDLNTVERDLRGPLSEVKSRSMMAFYPPCLCSLHYASVGLKVEQQGFIPGDTVTINLALMNDTHFTFVSLSLIQEITIVTKDKTMIERRTVMKLTMPDLMPEEGDDYRRWSEDLLVPTDCVVSSNAADYPDVKIQYFVRFSAEATKFPYQVIKILLPLTIGSQPLSQLLTEDDKAEDKLEDEAVEEPTKICGNEASLQEEVMSKDDVVTVVMTHPKVQVDDDDDIDDLENEPDPGQILPPISPIPPKIVFDLDDVSLNLPLPSPPPPEEEDQYPSLTDSFFLSLEESMIHVTPTRSPKSSTSTTASMLNTPTPTGTPPFKSSRVACFSSGLSPSRAFEEIDSDDSSGESKKFSDDSLAITPTATPITLSPWRTTSL